MKFRKLLLVVIIVVALIVPTTVYAATSTSTTAQEIHGLFGIDSSKLTDSQLADVKDYAQKMADLQKSLLDKLVSDGAMTQAKADAQKTKIDSDLAGGKIFEGGGRGGKGQNKINTSKLTDAQKTNLLALQKEQLSLQNDLAAVLVQQNLITQAQADAIKNKVNAKIALLTTANLSTKMMGCGMSGLSLLRGVTLTDAQKAAILGWTAKAATAEKKIVALYKDAGVITQAQADSMNTRIDTRAADPFDFTMPGHDKMDRGHRSNRSDSSQTGSASAAG